MFRQLLALATVCPTYDPRHDRLDAELASLDGFWKRLLVRIFG